MTTVSQAAASLFAIVAAWTPWTKINKHGIVAYAMNKTQSTSTALVGINVFMSSFSVARSHIAPKSYVFISNYMSNIKSL